MQQKGLQLTYNKLGNKGNFKKYKMEMERNWLDYSKVNIYNKGFRKMLRKINIFKEIKKINKKSYIRVAYLLMRIRD